MSKLGNIILGHVEEFVGANEELAETRLKICAKCPLLKNTPYGKVCNSKLYLNTKTMTASSKLDAGAQFYSFKGCGCRLDAKTRRPGEHCPAKLW